MFPPPVSRRVCHPGATTDGFSILEILIVITILSILISIASPAYENYRSSRDLQQVKEDILAIQTLIDGFYVQHNRFPDTLADINAQQMRDPWEQPYHYLNIRSYDRKSSEEMIRRDKQLKPVNSDYDLYSSGEDRLSRPPFTAKVSLDDIVRCNNGGYIGRAADY